MKLFTHRVKLFEMILLILFGGLMYISQVLLAVLANIELVSFLIIIITRKFGAKALISIYTFVGAEILTYGISMWVINYFYVWLVLWLAIMLLRRVDSAVVFSLVSAIFGLIFGSLCSLPYFIMGGISMGISNIITGIGYDLVHCVGNFVLCIALYKPLTKVFDNLIKPHK